MCLCAHSCMQARLLLFRLSAGQALKHLCETSPTSSTSSSAPAVQPGSKQGSVYLCLHAYASLFGVHIRWHACMQCCVHMHTHTTHSCLRDTHKHPRPTRAKARTPRHSFTRKVRTQKVPKIHEVANCTRQGLVHLVYPVMRVSQAPHVLRSLYAYMHPYKHRCAHIHACSRARARALSLSLHLPLSLSVSLSAPLSLCLTLSPSPLLPVSVSARSLSL